MQDDFFRRQAGPTTDVGPFEPVSPAVTAATRALETIRNGRAKVKLSSVLPRESALRPDVVRSGADRARRFVLGNGRQEPGGGPSFSIGLFGKLRPQGLDRRQSELDRPVGSAAVRSSQRDRHGLHQIRSRPVLF